MTCRMRGNHSAGGVSPPQADEEPLIRRRAIERRDADTRNRLLDRVAAEFREMPCLRLTAEQAERLFGLRPDVRQRVIGALIDRGLLRLDEDGRYAAAPC